MADRDAELEAADAVLRGAGSCERGSRRFLAGDFGSVAPSCEGCVSAGSSGEGLRFDASSRDCFLASRSEARSARDELVEVWE